VLDIFQLLLDLDLQVVEEQEEVEVVVPLLQVMLNIHLQVLSHGRYQVEFLMFL
jgi:hypothetical protein